METIESKYTQEDRIKFMMFRDYIKSMAEEQKFLRNQRKTEHLVGERKIPADEAAYKHHFNREQLRVLYAAYGVLRGKKFSEVENRYPEDNHPLKEYPFPRRIERVLKEHGFLNEND